MSIMQEYKQIKDRIGNHEWELLNKYLKTNPQLILSDIVYNRVNFEKFEEWKSKIN